MATYKDIDAILKRLPNDLPYKSSVKRVLMQAPEADVVPRSEVEYWKEEANWYQTLWCKTCDELEIADFIVEAKAEVARKIFAEINLIFRKYYEVSSEKSDLKLLEPIRQAERFIINEMWHEFGKLEKEYIGDKI